MFKHYVLNYNVNKKKVELFNIFDNITVFEETLKIVKKYCRCPKKFKNTVFVGEEPVYGFEAFCIELDSIIRWQEWSRVEYEIVVGGFPYHEGKDKLEKWDCYQQCKENIPMIAREVIFQYRKFLKEKNVTKKWVHNIGWITPGGDPSYHCPSCERGYHCYGIEHPNKYDRCPDCGQRLEYS